MAQRTTRDELWNCALKTTRMYEKPITAGRLSEITGASVRSARDVLNTMAEYNMLTKQQNGRETEFVAYEYAFVPSEERPDEQEAAQ